MYQDTRADNTIPVQKISLYDFAKMYLGGKEPESVVFLDADKNTVKSEIRFSGAKDYIPSVVFSVEDLITDQLTNTLVGNNLITSNLEFPGQI